MSAPFSVQGTAGIRAALIDELIALRDITIGPDRGDPAVSRPLPMDDDAVQMCAATYALPQQFRELGKSGVPLMWPWPWDLYQPGLGRRDELLLAATLLLVAIERLDRAPLVDGRRLQVVAADQVGQK